MIPESIKMGSVRHHLILQRMLMERTVRIKDLASAFDVHEMTIRRDLDLLAERGLLTRTLGGARLIEKASEEIAHQLRVTRNTEAKDAIAVAALGLVDDSDVIALDASTTASRLAHLLHVRRVTALVTGLDAANILANSGVPFVMVGGNFHGPARSFVGQLFTDTLSRLHPDKVFFSAQGFAPETGFTDAHLPEVGAKQALIRSAGTRIALLDASKFERRALVTIAQLKEIDVVITDRDPPPDTRAAFETSDLRLIITSQGAR